MKRVKLWVALVLVAVFSLGAASGGGIVYLAVGHRIRAIMQGPPEQTETKAIVMVLHRALHLTAVQRDQVTRVLLAHRSETNAVRRTIEPQLQGLRAQQKDEIRALLNSSQQAQFDVLYARFEERRRKALQME
jgi:hypothetical protein